MSLPNSWVDRLFAKLTVTYGHRFLGMYSGIDLDAVKADWSDELSHFQQSPDALKYALAHLPSDAPPNVFQFRDICRRAPQYVPKALPLPPVDPDMARAVKAMVKPVIGAGDRAWADKLRARIDAKEIRPTKYQRDAVAEVLGEAA